MCEILNKWSMIIIRTITSIVTQSWKVFMIAIKLKRISLVVEWHFLNAAIVKIYKIVYIKNYLPKEETFNEKQSYLQLNFPNYCDYVIFFNRFNLLPNKFNEKCLWHNQYFILIIIQMRAAFHTSIYWLLLQRKSSRELYESHYLRNFP